MLLSLVLQLHGLDLVLPLSCVDVLEGVRVSEREVLAENLDVVDWLSDSEVNVLLYAQNRLLSVDEFERYRQRRKD